MRSFIFATLLVSLFGASNGFLSARLPARRSLRFASTEAAAPERAIEITEGALTHLKSLRDSSDNPEEGGKLFLRMGVRSGGCSGMSYVMDVVKAADVSEDDHREDWAEENIFCVIDAKSLLYLYGLRLDYSTDLIGGGFKFENPSAESTCGCGLSFGV